MVPWPRVWSDSVLAFSDNVSLPLNQKHSLVRYWDEQIRISLSNVTQECILWDGLVSANSRITYIRTSESCWLIGDLTLSEQPDQRNCNILDFKITIANSRDLFLWNPGATNNEHFVFYHRIATIVCIISPIMIRM